MKRSDFLRRMKGALGFDDCDHTQMKNGFDRFLKIYTDIKEKLNESGFGIDPEKDSTLEKGNHKQTYDVNICINYLKPYLIYE